MKDSIIETLKNNKKDFQTTADLEPLIDKLKDKKVVMLGEASHGTHEYYQWRARISRKLLEEHGFDFVVVEGDWPPCYQLNRHIKNYEEAGNTLEILKEFKRWPSWMWANWEVKEFAEWLKGFNNDLSADKRKGFYGLDVYSLWESLDAIMDYLKKEDPSALETAKEAMKCFEPHRDGEGDGQRYAMSTRMVPEGCRNEVREMLVEIRNKAISYNSDKENVFSTEQNALVAKNAEEYYRVMVQGGASTWNLRDQHMMDTLNNLLEFHGSDAKGIVWAHNTHIGDASFTDMADDGLYNIGELAREEYGRDRVSLVGFGSYKGSVLAGSSWGAEVQKMNLPEAREGSWEHLCHKAGEQFYVFSEDLKSNEKLENRIPHRAVGVVYNPAHERFGNYVPTVIPDRYDAFVFFDKSEGLNNIDIKSKENKIPETYPFGF